MTQPTFYNLSLLKHTGDGFRIGAKNIRFSLMIAPVAWSNGEQLFPELQPRRLYDGEEVQSVHGPS
jgi:hypothetical protein